MRHAHTLLVAGASLLILLGTAACHHRSPVVTPPPAPAAAPAPAPVAPPPPPPPPPPAPAPAPTPLTEDQIFASKTLDQINAEHPLTDAFFDFDSAVIRPDAQASLTKDAAWLQRWTSTKVTISGHCDERGTAEYNLALGERRAAAVKSVPAVARRLGRPDADHQLRQGAAVLHRVRRGLLAAEPAGPLPVHGQVARRAAL